MIDPFCVSLSSWFAMASLFLEILRIFARAVFCLQLSLQYPCQCVFLVFQHSI